MSEFIARVKISVSDNLSAATAGHTDTKIFLLVRSSLSFLSLSHYTGTHINR